MPPSNSIPEASRSAPAGDRLTRTEQRLAAIWREVLDVDSVGLDEDYLELGGDSLLALRITARITEAWGVQVGLSEFLEHQTVRELASYVDSQVGGA